MLFSVDPSAPAPLFEQLAASIRGAIISGRVAVNERLPAARDLADALDINIHTVLRAYQALRDEGFIELRRGRGAVVTDRARDYTQLASDVERIIAEAKRLELTPGALSAMIREAW
jgi:GntR family transcriptional regulator